ncbi:hypothetical protein E0H72_25915 [Rhizobium leguminosarum bv. viciae]|nr:hypothetical protein E0H72_25915 [Rhizobium leguminosarum bv. viciae]
MTAFVFLMPWRETSVMEERLRFVARLLEGKSMSDGYRGIFAAVALEMLRNGFGRISYGHAPVTISISTNW